MKEIYGVLCPKLHGYNWKRTHWMEVKSFRDAVLLYTKHCYPFNYMNHIKVPCSSRRVEVVHKESGEIKIFDIWWEQKVQFFSKEVI